MKQVSLLLFWVALLFGCGLAQMIAIQTGCSGLTKKECKKKKGTCSFSKGSCSLKMSGGGRRRRGGRRRGGGGKDAEAKECSEYGGRGRCKKAAGCSWVDDECTKAGDVDSSGDSSEGGSDKPSKADKCAAIKSAEKCYGSSDCSWIKKKCVLAIDDSMPEAVEEPIVDKSLAGPGYCEEASELRKVTKWLKTEAECLKLNQPYCTYNCKKKAWAATRTCFKQSSSCGSKVVAQDIRGPLKVSKEEWEGFKLLNELRATGYGCPSSGLYGSVSYKPNNRKLVFDCNLWRAAYKHSQDMASHKYFEHTDRKGLSAWDRAEREGTLADSENIASGYFSAKEVLSQFRGSRSGHCNNMMNPAHKRFAIGYGTAYGGHKWTQMFSSECFKYDQNEKKPCEPEKHYDTSCYPEKEGSD